MTAKLPSSYAWDMRITIDDDIAAQLEDIRRSGKGSLKQITNDLLRTGLKRANGQPQARHTHHTKEVRLGSCLIDSIDDVAQALSIAEEEDTP